MRTFKLLLVGFVIGGLTAAALHLALEFGKDSEKMLGKSEFTAPTMITGDY